MDVEMKKYFDVAESVYNNIHFKNQSSKDLIDCLNRLLIEIKKEAAINNLQLKYGEFKHEVRQFQKPYDNQQAEQISLMV